MSLAPELHALRAAVRDYASLAPDIASFCGAALTADHDERPLVPAAFPATALVLADPPEASEATRPLLDAILSAAPHLRWRQSYTEADPGIDAHYLANYAWFNLIAPSGPFVSDDLRVSFGYWGQGLQYPWHHHQPEEIYLTVAGSALYQSAGRASVEGGPGTTICHYANQPHAARMDRAPLLAAAFWRGDALEAKPDIPG